MAPLKIFNREFKLPKQKWLRVVLGISLIFGGVLGFLPVVGFWMLPLGILVLSMDFPIVLRFKRRVIVKWARWRQLRAKRARAKGA